MNCIRCGKLISTSSKRRKYCSLECANISQAEKTKIACKKRKRRRVEALLANGLGNVISGSRMRIYKTEEY